jgi:hypothetical protein
MDYIEYRNKRLAEDPELAAEYEAENTRRKEERKLLREADEVCANCVDRNSGYCFYECELSPF